MRGVYFKTLQAFFNTFFYFLKVLYKSNSNAIKAITIEIICNMSI
nr:MAG TPA: hypothetical protein [Caudoviricetes sp.]